MPERHNNSMLLERTTPATIRAATYEDLACILEIEQVCFSDPWSFHSFEDAMRDERTVLLVAETTSGTAGYGTGWTVGPEGEVAHLAVCPAARGQGIGGDVLQALIDEFGSRGAREVFLEVRVSNTTAQRLYLRAGFYQVGRRPRYYRDGEDAIIMRKDI